MTRQTPPPFADMQDLRNRLARLATDAPPMLAQLALWLVNRPEELAFCTVRALAAASGSNANTVVRLARALGFAGYEPLRATVQQLLRHGAGGYAARAQALAGRGERDLLAEQRLTAHDNIDRLFTPGTESQLRACAAAALQARAVHCIAVRSSYALSHYFSYVGGMAFANIRPAPAQPGFILDSMAASGPEDIVIAATYAHYSSEVLRGVAVARERGARVVALTDSYTAPVAEDAWQVYLLPMDGPQLLPSLAAAFLLVEALLAEMTAQAPEAEARIRDFEDRMLAVGGYMAAR